MKWSRLFLSLLLVLVALVTAFSLVAHADDLFEAVTATETEEAENGQSIGHDEQPEEPQEEPDVTEYESTVDQQSTRTTTPFEYITSSDYEYEILLTLKSMEYQLKIISGGIILAVISAFIWFMYLKTLKRFSSF